MCDTHREKDEGEGQGNRQGLFLPVPKKIIFPTMFLNLVRDEANRGW